MNSIMIGVSGRLDDEAFYTFLCETENIINCRPLTTENLGDPSSEVITANHLLTMKSKLVLPPPGEFQRADVYCRKRWRAVQHMANKFWIRWKKEYVVNLQQRDKWTGLRRNFQIGDVVLLKDGEGS